MLHVSACKRLLQSLPDRRTKTVLYRCLTNRDCLNQNEPSISLAWLCVVKWVIKTWPTLTISHKISIVYFLVCVRELLREVKKPPQVVEKFCEAEIKKKLLGVNPTKSIKASGTLIGLRSFTVHAYLQCGVPCNLKK